MSLLNYCCGLLLIALATPVQAQSITTADTATNIQQTDNVYQIGGGDFSGDSSTLFHSFEQFGLLTQETALFDNPATVENIIGRVVGGDVSVIDGLLSVEGTASLYLVNPAGVIFGNNARLNLAGSFSASTATGLLFGNDQLDTLGTNDFTGLNGAPTGYLFSNETAGAIVNTGNLAVGQSLTLLGGQVINTGQLSAPNGELLVMAVPGENLVRLSQSGSLLGLELETIPDAVEHSADSFTAATLAALLTGAASTATDITINADGTVTLSGSSLQIPTDPGTAIVSGQLETDGGTIGILGDQIALVGAAIDASGETGGGSVLIGGDRLGAGSVPNATATVIDETSVVNADSRDRGDGGTIVAWGNDVLRVEGQLSAQGGANGGNGGFIETSSLNLLDVRTTPDITAANGADGLWLLDPANIRIVAGFTATNVNPINPFDVGPLVTDAELGVELIRAALIEGGNVEVRTTGNTPGDGNITLEVPLDYDNTGDSSLSLIAAGEIQILADIFDSVEIITSIEDPISGEVPTFVPSPDNLDLTLQANGQITVADDVVIDTNTGLLFLESLQGDISVSGDLNTSSGDVVLKAPEGSITVATPIETAIAIPAIGVPDNGGDVIVEAQDAVNINNIDTRAASVSGSVVIESQTSITVGEIDTSAFSEGAELAGDVDLIAEGDIVFSSIDASSDSADGGDVSIESSEGLVRGIGLLPSSSNTISTDGGFEDGDIFIAHNGGSIPFIVGDSSVNGTAGDITTGALTLNDIALEESFDGELEVGNIEIITSEIPEEPEEPEEPEDIVDEILDETDCDCIRNESPAEIDPIVETASESSSTVASSTVSSSIEQKFSAIEDRLTTEFNDYLQLESETATEPAELASAQSKLLAVQQKTGKRPALIYAVFGLDQAADGSVLAANAPAAPLELLLVTADGEPTFVSLDVTRQEVLTMAHRLRRQVSTPSRADREDVSYLRSAQNLYQWLIAPVQAQLEAQNIDTISFITDAGLRSLPLAALHDGESFVIQNYNIGLMPSLSLTDLTYHDISNTSALIAGTSTFADQAALPGVPLELEAISSRWSSKVLRGNAFSLNQLRDERQQSPYGVIHLATHGEFNVGELSESYLYLYNERLSLDQLRTLGLNRPPVELLTLSACQTALGNRSAELGFAGFAVLAGAKTSVASLWNVSDEASAGLMIEFYRQLQANQPTIKAEALRQAQLAMIQGEISVDGAQLKGVNAVHKLPAELVIEGQQDFRHPYYWATFSLVGSPW